MTAVDDAEAAAHADVAYLADYYSHDYAVAGTNGDQPDEPDTRTSWWPVPLGTTVTPPAVPTLLHRADGQPLLYPGRLHAFIGESESCKTWAALLAVIEVTRMGGRALIVDFEDTPETCTNRLVALGATPTSLELVDFLHPDEPLIDRNGRLTRTQIDYRDILNTPHLLAVIDGVTEGMTLEGMDPLDNADIAKWYRHVTRPPAETGAATVIVDHVTKNSEQRGRYAIGGVHKLNGLDGAGYLFETQTPFTPNQTGRVRLTVAKDRPGQVRAQSERAKYAGELRLTPKGDGSIVAAIHPAEAGEFLPTHIMARVSEYLALYPDASKADLRNLGHSAHHVDAAIRALVDLGHVTVIAKGSRHVHHLERPYTAPQDAPEDDPGGRRDLD